MTLRMGLSAAQTAAYKRTLGKHHSIRVLAEIWDLDHRFVQNVSHAAPDGQINIDATADVSRSAQVTLFDPTKAIAFDTANPMAGTVSPRYLISLKRGVYVDEPELSDWVDVPVGVLWIAAAARQGDTLILDARGKEALLNYPFTNPNAAGAPYTFKKGIGIAQAIRTLLALYGETRLRMVPSTAKLGRDFVITTDMTTWQAIKQLAKAAGCVAFYDAEGFFNMRPPGKASVYTFQTGVGGTIRTVGDIGFAADQMVNAVIGTGQTPTTANTEPPHGIWKAPSGNPLRLVRNGVVINLPMLVTNETLKTSAQVKAFATQAGKDLTKGGQETVTLGVTSSPVCHLQEYDAVTAIDYPSNYTVNVSWMTASMPLRLGSQTNGFQRRIQFRRASLPKRGSPS